MKNIDFDTFLPTDALISAATVNGYVCNCIFAREMSYMTFLYNAFGDFFFITD